MPAPKGRFSVAALKSAACTLRGASSRLRELPAETPTTDVAAWLGWSVRGGGAAALQRGAGKRPSFGDILGGFRFVSEPKFYKLLI